MKNHSLFLLFLSLPALSSVPLSTVNRSQFGESWAFTKEEVQLRCSKDHALFVINESTLAQYPLNDLARKQIESGQIVGESIDRIHLSDTKNPKQKMSLQPFIDAAEKLCQFNK